MVEAPPITLEIVDQIIQNMSQDDAEYLSEMFIFRLSPTLYQTIKHQADLDEKGMAEWIRRACLSYARHRNASRKEVV